MSIPRVEALHASTLGWESATPTELLGVRTVHNGLIIPPSWVEVLHASTLGWGSATPTELLGMRSVHDGLLMLLSSAHCSLLKWMTKPLPLKKRSAKIL